MIPTAEEFYTIFCNKRITVGSLNGNERLQIMIEFAKLHVEAALKAAKLEADKFVDENEEECYKPQIFNTYPLENIK